MDQYHTDGDNAALPSNSFLLASLEPHAKTTEASIWSPETSKGYLGLDLVVIKSIVDKLGGSISFDQDTDSREIKIQIPCSEEDQVSNKTKVLFAEDDDILRELMVYFLERAGYQS